MAYNEQIADRIRELLISEPVVEEKKMFQGICFLVHDKMCICVRENDILCRIGAEQAEIELAQDRCRPMVNNGRVMKDFVYVSLEDVPLTKTLKYWIDLCLKFNVQAKKSKSRKKDIKQGP